MTAQQSKVYQIYNHKMKVPKQANTTAAKQPKFQNDQAMFMFHQQ